MLPHKKREIIDELTWHFEKPHEVYEILTDADKDVILKKGFMPKDLFLKVSARLECESA